MKKVLILATIYISGVLQTALSQEVLVKEQSKIMNSYIFSDPNPIATPSNLFYPYSRFDGFSIKGVNKEWKTVELENDYIKVTIFPEVGGKIWGAFDKTTGKNFLYNNGVVKFRDIAMRGPWTSGGIEFNFGIIGHAPTSSTPIDYLVKKKDDGSISCYIFSYEWLTRTVWNVEVNLPKDKAYFTTHTTWYNQSLIDQPYYHWMNAGYPVGEDAQFCYPGDYQISHSGKPSTFPINEEGCNIGTYEGNNFGNSKSYHVLGYYNDFYGIYWHGEDFGSIHHAAFDEKLGMKIFLWGQSREGGIWENLLTDSDGQYIELQSGRVFNQPASNSAYTPYKHFSFSPQLTDQWTEYWFPVKGIKGVSKASRIGALNVTREDGSLIIALSPLESLSTNIKLYKGKELVDILPLNTKVLEPVILTVSKNKFIPQGQLKVIIGDNLLVYSENREDFDLERPMETSIEFDWNSVYGLFTQGEQWMNQKIWDKAESYLNQSLQKDPCFSPALVRLASLYYREGLYQQANELLVKELSLDTYNGEANYLYGLVNRKLGKIVEAKAAFSIAAFSAQFRTAAYEQLGELYAAEQNWIKAEHYALKSLEYNDVNLNSHQLLILVYRKTGKLDKAQKEIQKVLIQLPLYHPVRFEESYLAGNTTVDQLKDFSSLIRNELPFETYLEMAGWYERVGCIDEALLLLSCISENPIALYQKAFLLNEIGREDEAKSLVVKANDLSPDFVFPFRPETIKYLDWASTVLVNWKQYYYKSLIYWANQQKSKALDCLNLCNDANYYPLYLTRSNLKQGQDRLDDILKAEKIEKSWRVGLALANYYSENKNWNNLVEIGEKYMEIYPENYYIGLKYATGLCETGQYLSCISLLKKLMVLPNEGAYAGRAVYRAANLYQAMDLIKRHKYDLAFKYVKLSKEWPENLGVGKPFDYMMDNRLEDFLEAKILVGKGKIYQAKKLYKKVIDKEVSKTIFESGNLLTLLAMKEIGKIKEANQLVNLWMKDFHDNKLVEWCSAIYFGENVKAEELLKNCYKQNETTPWESDYRDNNLNLIIRLFK